LAPRATPVARRDRKALKARKVSAVRRPLSPDRRV
jgi:hypothetical protein